MKDFKEKYADPWKDYMKKYETLYWAPGKPSDQERKIFCKFIKKVKGAKKALVLGATPAVRDSLAKFDIEVTLLDASKDIIKGMDQLITHNKKENKIEGNWLKMPFEDNSFDIVMGDLIIGNLNAENQQKFLREVKRVLKPKGYLIHRIFYIPLKLGFGDTEDILEMFSKFKQNYDRNTELFICLMYNTYNPKTNEVYTSEIKKTLAKYRKGNKYVYPDKKVEKLMNRTYEMWQPFEKVWHCGTKKEVFSWISEEFDIIKEKSAKDHIFGKWFPIIMCRAK